MRVVRGATHLVADQYGSHGPARSNRVLVFTEPEPEPEQQPRHAGAQPHSKSAAGADEHALSQQPELDQPMNGLQDVADDLPQSGGEGLDHRRYFKVHTAFEAPDASKFHCESATW
jgi:hypothetical protein